MTDTDASLPLIPTERSSATQDQQLYETGDATMKNLAEAIAKALVDEPELVTVDVVNGKCTTLLTLSVGINDTGKIIGRKGRTVGAIRTILSAMGSKANRRVVFEVEDKRRQASRSPIPLADRQKNTVYGVFTNTAA